jgi:hypothetical protein
MNRIIAITIALILLGSVSFGRTIDVPVSQVALIAPGIHNEDPLAGPRLCLKFVIPEEIRGIEIGYAELKIEDTLPVVYDDSLAIIEAFGLSSAWSEGVGWNDFPTAGGDIDSNYYATYTHHCGIDTLVSLDITQMAQNWNTNSEANFGLIIIPRTSDWNAFREFTPQLDRLRNLITLRILIPGREEE